MKFKNIIGLFLCCTCVSLFLLSFNFSANATEPTEDTENYDQSSYFISKDSRSSPIKIQDYINKNDTLLSKQSATDDENSSISFDGNPVDPEICKYFKETYGSKKVDLASEIYMADRAIMDLYTNGKISFDDIISAISLHELRIECVKLIIPNIEDMI